MQSKGWIRLVAILLAIASIWQLSFTAVTTIQEKKAEKFAEKAAVAAQNSADFAKVAIEDQAYYLDSIRKDCNRVYIDSISNRKVFLWNTYKECKTKEINLGLDLKGGMNVMLQVQLQDLVKALAGNNADPAFLKALSLAKERSVNSREDFITLFADAWKEVSGGQRLAKIFGTYEMKDRIKAESTDAEVIAVIREEAESAVANSFNVLRNRIDRFGVTQPSIQKLGNSGRILVELPGVKEPERVRKLLQGTASLEFWETFTNQEVAVYLAEANSKLAEILADGEEEVAVEEPAADSSAAESVADTLLNAELASQETSKELEAYRKANPLFAVLTPSQTGDACIGFAAAIDTAKVNKYLKMPQIAEIFPAEFRAMWTVHPSERLAADNIYELVAIKSTSKTGKAKLDGGVVTDARTVYENGQNGEPSVSMSMNAEGANIWARMTGDNVGKQIAIVLDGMVYSYPMVNGAITGGNSSITGHFTPEEANDLVNVLKSGKLPAPATIIQEQVVGPSLGARSIQAGMISFIIAFVLVLLYMIFFYKGAGVAADLALLCNVLLLFGVLVSFGAVLTLPGIAGLVLTMGMAVDANVIIYERIKEELAAGKGLSKAVADGYKNAYSAIIDGQVTTLLTGIVLFIFGSGPVQGFATTLIIGIITSVLTSIFITRLYFESRISKGKKISFESNLTKNFLKNTSFDFIKARKVTYIVSGALILISLVSIFTKGFTYGVDFTGGRTYVVRFDQPVTAEQVREAAIAEFDGAVEVKQFGGESQMKITTQYKNDEESSEVDAEVEAKLYNALIPFFEDKNMTIDQFKSTLDNPNGIISSDKVGPTIANDIKRDAIIAVILALFVIFAYIAVRFKGWTWGLGGVVSLAHTALIVIGFFSLFSGILPFNLDVDQTFIAAILTIIGYAINDNVVIFDRIREYRLMHPNADLKENTNLALNATLTRTVNTSVSTLVTMLAIAIFGGESIRGLAVALILGICIGTYASIFIGTPVMYDATIRSKAKAADKAKSSKK
ncbi:MAG: protein translocase subunit SecDF [Bacteroidales bacterium]|uniref:protein translocase subunit SecDF n=1 Tax=Candidatus Cryptobacteroides sp. TaxID=2952915 RepID=UPI002A7FF78F|nr:protein translocase subunit SecDF [Candidatus Cryptobacteroides sp.]MBS7278098.1 protein translocase subunit SecDF [Bacteroidales bacterium]MDD7134798.1 protein translocase subunit SecDF [Bacteroidales bacterium]MDD7624427.1 protein translocase subunit SecDF [Bacteroidales bacterium]MDY3879050.1 protein translocase subunit SecDF [Candidatus Cryptobacteroides sp.]MDY5043209.1 protein translocase subunit SecDF [Candidatus Cryptobacteroides sp.]